MGLPCMRAALMYLAVTRLCVLYLSYIIVMLGVGHIMDIAGFLHSLRAEPRTRAEV